MMFRMLLAISHVGLKSSFKAVHERRSDTSEIATVVMNVNILESLSIAISLRKSLGSPRSKFLGSMSNLICVASHVVTAEIMLLSSLGVADSRADAHLKRSISERSLLTNRFRSSV